VFCDRHIGGVKKGIGKVSDLGRCLGGLVEIIGVDESTGGKHAIVSQALVGVG